MWGVGCQEWKIQGSQGSHELGWRELEDPRFTRIWWIGRYSWNKWISWSGASMNLRSNLVILWRKIYQYVVQYDVAFYCGFGILITIACSFPSSRSFILYHLRNVCCCCSLSLLCWGVIVFLMHILFKRMHLLVLCQEVSQHTSIHLPSPSCILGENNFWWRFLMCLIPPNLHQYTHHDTGNEYHVSVLLLSCQEHVYQMFMEFSPISASPDTRVSLLSWYSARTKYKNKRLDPHEGVWHQVRSAKSLWHASRQGLTADICSSSQLQITNTVHGRVQSSFREKERRVSSLSVICPGMISSYMIRSWEDSTTWWRNSELSNQL